MKHVHEDWALGILGDVADAVSEVLGAPVNPATLEHGTGRIASEWLRRADWRCVVVYTEAAGTGLPQLRDPFHDEAEYEKWHRVASILRGRWHIADAGWESINPAVGYFWIQPAPVG